MSLKTKLVYEFDEFRVDVEESRLSWRDEVVALKPKVVETLIALIEANGRMVKKEELMERLWPDSHVEEANLTVNISQLRKALGQSVEGESYIETIPRRGYKFSAAVKELRVEAEQLIVREYTATEITIEEQDESRPSDAIARLVIESAEAAQPERKFRVATLAAAAILLIAGLSYFIYTFLDQKKLANKAFNNTSVERLPITGTIASIALSRDGKFLAYIDGESGKNMRLMLRQMETGSEKEIIAVKGAQISLHSFSPDGNYFYFYYGAEGAVIYQLRRVALLGGEITDVPFVLGTNSSFSPDGKKIVYINASDNGDTHHLVVSDIDGKNQTVVHSSSDRYFLSPKFSPDGNKILLAFGEKSEEIGRSVRLGWIPSSGGELTRLGDSTWNLYHLGETRAFYEWLKDGSGIVIANKFAFEEQAQIFLIGFPNGELTRITKDKNYYAELSMTAESRIIAAIKTTEVSGVWEFDLQTKIAKQIASSNNLATGGIIADEHKIIFIQSDGQGNRDLWQMNLDGTEEKLLISQKGRIERPRPSTDGRHLYFTTNGRSGKSPTFPTNAIWRAGIDGTDIEQLTHPSGVSHELSGLSPDNGIIIIREWSTNRHDARFLKLDLASGQITPIHEDRSLHFYLFELSPDGRHFLCGSSPKIAAEGQTAKATYRLLDFDGTKPGNTKYSLPESAGFWALLFAPDGKSVYYFDWRNRTDIWQYEFSSGKSHKITDFNLDAIYTFSISRDGSKLYIVRGSAISEAMLIKSAE